MKATGIVRRIEAGVIISLRSKNRRKPRSSADFIRMSTMDDLETGEVSRLG